MIDEDEAICYNYKLQLTLGLWQCTELKHLALRSVQYGVKGFKVQFRLKIEGKHQQNTNRQDTLML